MNLDPPAPCVPPVCHIAGFEIPEAIAERPIGNIRIGFVSTIRCSYSNESRANYGIRRKTSEISVYRYQSFPTDATNSFIETSGSPDATLVVWAFLVNLTSNSPLPDRASSALNPQAPIDLINLGAIRMPIFIYVRDDSNARDAQY